MQIRMDERERVLAPSRTVTNWNGLGLGIVQNELEQDDKIK